MNTRTLIVGGTLVVIAIGWYLFRPERLFINKSVSEQLPDVTTQASTHKGPVTLAQGRFRSVAHETRGTATVYQFADGKRVLRLTEFETSNGPDVQIYLVAAPDARDNETVTKAGFIHVAALKGNIGDQNYDLPANLDLNKYRSVTVWCRRFSVNFGTAPLSGAEAMVGSPGAVH